MHSSAVIQALACDASAGLVAMANARAELEKAKAEGPRPQELQMSFIDKLGIHRVGRRVGADTYAAADGGEPYCCGSGSGTRALVWRCGDWQRVREDGQADGPIWFKRSWCKQCIKCKQCFPTPSRTQLIPYFWAAHGWGTVDETLKRADWERRLGSHMLDRSSDREVPLFSFEFQYDDSEHGYRDPWCNIFASCSIRILQIFRTELQQARARARTLSTIDLPAVNRVDLRIAQNAPYNAGGRGSATWLQGMLCTRLMGCPCQISWARALDSDEFCPRVRWTSSWVALEKFTILNWWKREWVSVCIVCGTPVGRFEEKEKQRWSRNAQDSWVFVESESW